jgi:DNA-binding MarR family transcriptional regulator
VPLSPQESPGLLLWHVTLAWQRQVAAILTPFDLTHVQFVLLAVTWWSNTQDSLPTQAEAAALAGADVKMTSQVLRTLERKGLLVRNVDPADTRARRLQATDAGAELAPLAIAAVEEVDRRFFAPVQQDEALVLLRALTSGER